MKTGILTCFITAALSARRTSAPPGCLVVSKSGSSGGYSTIRAAVDALAPTSVDAQCIFINPGTYPEQVLVSARSAQLTIYGYTSDMSTYSSQPGNYHGE